MYSESILKSSTLTICVAPVFLSICKISKILWYSEINVFAKLIAILLAQAVISVGNEEMIENVCYAMKYLGLEFMCRCPSLRPAAYLKKQAG